MNSEPLMPIWEAYLVTTEALKVSKRVIIFSKKAKATLHGLDENESEMTKRTLNPKEVPRIEKLTNEVPRI